MTTCLALSADTAICTTNAKNMNVRELQYDDNHNLGFTVSVLIHFSVSSLGIVKTSHQFNDKNLGARP